MKSLLRCTVLLAAFAGLASPAGATAIYSAAASSTFTVTPLGPVSAIVDQPTFTDTPTTGTGVASIDLSASSASGVHPATIDSMVSGSASAPPSSSSSAEVRHGHLFTVPRGSPVEPLPTVELRFTFVISWDTHLEIDLPGTEFAAGGAYFAISGFEDGIDSIVLDAGMPGTIVGGGERWEFNPSYFTFGPPVDETHTMTVTGTITVLAGRVGEFSVITDTAGRALAFAVPAPAPLALLALPLAWLAWRSRRPARSRG